VSRNPVLGEFPVADSAIDAAHVLIVVQPRGGGDSPSSVRRRCTSPPRPRRNFAPLVGTGMDWQRPHRPPRSDSRLCPPDRVVFLCQKMIGQHRWRFLSNIRTVLAVFLSALTNTSIKYVTHGL
jgi:hypothetical protein